MKLSDYSQKVGVHYHTAWRWFKTGKIKGYQMDTGTIIITEEEEERPGQQRVAIYTRVSSAEMKENLERQADRLLDYCMAKGWQVHKVVKEIGSGVNDNRRQFLNLLNDPAITIIVVEHKDRATRLGFNYIETLLALQGRRIEVVNLAENGKEDLLDDLAAIIYSFCARLYGQRRAKQKTEKITKELLENGT
jgi:predicted site-specific integrase-resolvase